MPLIPGTSNPSPFFYVSRDRGSSIIFAAGRERVSIPTGRSRTIDEVKWKIICATHMKIQSVAQKIAKKKKKVHGCVTILASIPLV